MNCSVSIPSYSLNKQIFRLLFQFYEKQFFNLISLLFQLFLSMQCIDSIFYFLAYNELTQEYNVWAKLRRVFLIVHFQSSLSEVYSRLKLELDLLQLYMYMARLRSSEIMILKWLLQCLYLIYILHQWVLPWRMTLLLLSSCRTSLNIHIKSLTVLS